MCHPQRSIAWFGIMCTAPNTRSAQGSTAWLRAHAHNGWLGPGGRPARFSHRGLTTRRFWPKHANSSPMLGEPSPAQRDAASCV